MKYVIGTMAPFRGKQLVCFPQFVEENCYLLTYSFPAGSEYDNWEDGSKTQSRITMALGSGTAKDGQQLKVTCPPP